MLQFLFVGIDDDYVDIGIDDDDPDAGIYDGVVNIDILLVSPSWPGIDGWLWMISL